MVKNPPANAGDVGSVPGLRRFQGRGFRPWSEKIPHAKGHLSPWATARERPRATVKTQRRQKKNKQPDHESSWENWGEFLGSLRSEKQQLVKEGIGEPSCLMSGGKELVKKFFFLVQK